MPFGYQGVWRRSPLAVVAILLPALALAQTPVAGLPTPDIRSEVSLRAAVAELDRSPATVVAEVGSRTVTWGELADAIRGMPVIVGAIPFQQLYQNAAVQVMQQKALALLAEKGGLDKDPLVQRRVQDAADQALATEYLRRSLAPNVTSKGLRAVYDGVIAGKPGPEEVRARVIMVDSREEAESLIKRLQSGSEFAALARAFSKDGTAASGGDLGYARLDMLAPEIGSVVFSLGLGQITAFPVRSANEWFIIKVEGRQQPPAPDFDTARAKLEQDVIHAGIPELKRMALQSAPVTYYGLAGKTAAATEAK